MRSLAANWLNKRIFCRTYKQKKALSKAGNNSKSEKSVKDSPLPISRSSNNSRTSEVDSSSTSSSFSSSNRSDSFKHTKQQKNIYLKQEKIQHQQHVQASALAYPPSIISSTASATSTHRKQISPIIAAAADTAAATAKAAAAISASMAQPSIYDNYNSKKAFSSDENSSKKVESPTFSNDTIPTSASPINSSNNRIKMIDTDIDDIDDIDLDIGNHDQLSKLSEEKDQEIIQPQVNNEQPPPSFNTAIRAKPESTSNSYRHQYQNTMDLEALVQR